MLKKLGILLIIVGFCGLSFSFYIRSQVEDGKRQIHSAEHKVNKGKKLFSVTPITKPIGNLVTASAEEKIAAGKEEVFFYEGIEQILMIAGIICIAAGLGMIIFKKKRDEEQNAYPDAYPK